MRVLTVGVSVLLLGCASLLPQQAALASSSHGTRQEAHTAASFAPVVIEWFSKTAPRAGESVTVFVRFVNNNQPVPGAQMRASIKLNSRTLLKLKGNMTSAKGLAKAKFVIPKAAAGKTLMVHVTVTYQGKSYPALNRLKVSTA